MICSTTDRFTPAKTLMPLSLTSSAKVILAHHLTTNAVQCSNSVHPAYANSCSHTFYFLLLAHGLCSMLYSTTTNIHRNTKSLSHFPLPKSFDWPTESNLQGKGDLTMAAQILMLDPTSSSDQPQSLKYNATSIQASTCSHICSVPLLFSKITPSHCFICR